MNDMEYVRTEVCTERHQRNREELKTLETRVNNHGKELDALSVDFAEHVATQAEINRQTLEQLKELQKRTAEIEEQTEDGWIVRAEVFGKGIEMWVRSQGEYVKNVDWSR